MPTSPRLRGNVLPIFTLELDGGSAVDFAADTKSIALDNKTKSDSDMTFAEAAAGAGYDWTLKVKIVASFVTTALFGCLMENRGKTAKLVWGPWGNATPDAQHPHFVLDVKLPAPPLTTQASTDVAKSAESEIEFQGLTDVTVLKA